MERVDLAALDGAPGRHQRLSGHLSPEDALAFLVGALASEHVDLDGLEIEEGDECIEGGSHGVHPGTADFTVGGARRYALSVRPFSSVVERVRTPGGRKALRYSLVSVVSVAVSQTSLFLFFAVGHWTAKSANIAACSIGGIPSYYLNRRWAWGKKGRSHFWKEIVPFWTLAFVGLAFSTLAVDVTESWAHDVADSRLVQGLMVNAASFGAFGVLWVAKFFLFNKVIFVQDDDLRELLADEVVA